MGKIVSLRLSRLSAALLSLFLSGLVLMGLMYWVIDWQLPDSEALKDMHLQVPLRVYSADHQLMAEFGTKKRIPVSLSEIPKPLVNAVLAVEDARFYEHPGVDVIGLVRAARAVLLSGRKVQGASTITMQVARNFFLTRHKTIWRKLREIVLALKIDQVLTKDKILELYLNKVYLGQRAYGVAAAAEIYYGKPLSDLTLAQMAMLAGLPQSPSGNNPLVNPQKALSRRNHVLSRMVQVGSISQADADQASRAPITAQLHRQAIPVSAPYVAEMVRQLMIKEYGDAAYERGIEVVTTIRPDLQQAAQAALRAGLLDYSQRHGYRQLSVTIDITDPSQWQQALKALPSLPAPLSHAVVLQSGLHEVRVGFASGKQVVIPWSGLVWARAQRADGSLGALPTRADAILHPGQLVMVRPAAAGSWQLTEKPAVQGALVSLQPYDGAIVACVGGFDFQDSHFNRATQAWRQPGSNFKPFIYSAALAKGYTLASLVNDAPVVFADSGENSWWRPNNDTHRFYGMTRLREGLTQSRNLVSIRLLQAMGIDYVRSYVQRFGFDAAQLPNSLSLALGTGLVTPTQLAGAYAVLANGGYQVLPHVIDSISMGGKLVYTASAPHSASMEQEPVAVAGQADPSITAKSVIAADNAYLMVSALQGVIQHGTASAARVLKRSDLAGKTGTTNDQVDAWFSGFHPRLVTTVWVGFDEMSSLHEYAAQAALPIWIAYMRKALATLARMSWQPTADIVTARIDPRTGLLARPQTRGAIFEHFRSQTVPTQLTPTEEDR